MEAILERDETFHETEEIGRDAEVPKNGNGTEETTETETQEVPEKSGTEETSQTKEGEAQVLEFNGEKFTAEELKEMREAYKNKSEWQKDFTQKSQAAKEELRRIETEKKAIQEAMFIREKLSERPELLQQIYAPKQERNFAEEERLLWSQRPPDPSTQEYGNWEYQKTLFYNERAKQEAIQEALKQNKQTAAVDYNGQLSVQAWDKFSKEGVEENEFQDMAQWILSNLKQSDGKFPKNSYDIAYMAMFPDRQVRKEKIEATKKASQAIEKAKPANVEGASKTTEKETSDDDDAFIAELRARKRRS